MAIVTLARSRIRTVVLWTLRILSAASFLIAAILNLSGKPEMLAEFNQVGLGSWLRYLTAALQLFGGITVLVPRSSLLGAVVLELVVVGAFVAQITVLHTDLIHTFVLAALLGLLIYLQRDMPMSFAALRHPSPRPDVPQTPAS